VQNWAVKFTDDYLARRRWAESLVWLPPEMRQAMPNYRIFRLSSDEQIFGVSEMVGLASDQEAIDHAKSKLDGLDLEVWDGPRLVIRLKSTHG
jgi:hypothetical protein